MVKVSDAIKAFEEALAKLKTLNPDTEVVGAFYEGGYSGDASELKKMYFNILFLLDADQALTDRRRSLEDDVQEANIVELTAAFISK